MTNSVKNQSQINQSQIWGYSLLNCTIDGLIRSFEGQEGVKSYANFREKKKTELMNSFLNAWGNKNAYFIFVAKVM